MKKVLLILLFAVLAAVVVDTAVAQTITVQQPFADKDGDISGGYNA